MKRYGEILRVAHELKMSPREYMSSHTHLEHETWVMWLNEQWNQPSRTDNYLMNIQAEVRRIFAKNPRKVVGEDFRLKFVFENVNTMIRNPETVEQKKKQAAAWSKARWLGMMTAEIKEVEESRESVESIKSIKSNNAGGKLI